MSIFESLARGVSQTPRRPETESRAAESRARSDFHGMNDDAFGDMVERDELQRWIRAQKIDYNSTSKKDQIYKDALIPEFNYVLSRGIYAKMHTAESKHACQIHFRLHPDGDKLVWVGGVASSYSGSRELPLAAVSLVSVGKSTASFNSCGSAELADAGSCMSLILPSSLVLGEPQSLDLEFSTPSEVSQGPVSPHLYGDDSRAASFLH